LLGIVENPKKKTQYSSQVFAISGPQQTQMLFWSFWQPEYSASFVVLAEVV
jgi:hypothetical protein